VILLALEGEENILPLQSEYFTNPLFTSHSSHIVQKVMGHAA